MLISSLDAGDHAGVLDIYNHYVSHSPATFDTTPFNMAQRIPWFAQFESDQYDCLVAKTDEGLAGYACSTRFKERAAYASSIEVSVYCHPERQAAGVGSALYSALFERIGTQQHHRAYAGIAIPNDASVSLHKKFGFVQAGHFREVGYKFDQYWDVLWFEKNLDD